MSFSEIIEWDMAWVDLPFTNIRIRWAEKSLKKRISQYWLRAITLPARCLDKKKNVPFALFDSLIWVVFGG